MIEKIIEYSARNRVIILMMFGLIIAWGVWSVYKTPVDAIPDLSDNQVIVFTDYPGRSPQVVEDQVTYPLAVNLQGLPQVRAVRASSAFGFSMIYVIFEDKADIYWARTRVLERLNYAASLLPPGVVPTLGPDGTGVGHVFWYTIEGKGYDLEQLRTLQDWFVRYQLNTVQGVAEVASIGGLVREYQIDLDPNKLFAYNIKVGKVMDAVKASNKDVGGQSDRTGRRRVPDPWSRLRQVQGGSGEHRGRRRHARHTDLPEKPGHRADGGRHPARSAGDERRG